MALRLSHKLFQLVDDLQIAKVVVPSFKGGVSREEEEEEVVRAKFPSPPSNASTFGFSFIYLRRGVRVDLTMGPLNPTKNLGR